MLIPFSSKAAADFFMFEQHARPIFELMGEPFAPKGVISGLEAAQYLQQLQRGLAALQPEQAADARLDANDLLNDQANEPPPQSVGLKQRAWPLMDMLARASAKNTDVVWGVAL